MKSWLKGGLIGFIVIWILVYYFVIRLSAPRIIPELSVIIFISLFSFGLGALIGWLVGKPKKSMP